MTTQPDKLIIFDIDETLIYSANKRLKIDCAFQFGKYHVYPRPDLLWFLKRVAEHFQIGIWSAADEEYVCGIVEKVLPKEIELTMMWGQSYCVAREDSNSPKIYYEKPLEQVAVLGYHLGKIILVDDYVVHALRNKGNSIIVKPFKGDPNDTVLKSLYDYLLNLKDIDDVRKVDKQFRDATESRFC